MLPVTQKPEESLESPRPSGTAETPGATLGEGLQDARMEKSTQLSCSVKEEPGVDRQELGEEASPELGAAGGIVCVPGWDEDPRGTAELGLGGRGWRQAALHSTQ